MEIGEYLSWRERGADGAADPLRRTSILTVDAGMALIANALRSAKADQRAADRGPQYLLLNTADMAAVEAGTAVAHWIAVAFEVVRRPEAV